MSNEIDRVTVRSLMNLRHVQTELVGAYNHLVDLMHWIRRSNTKLDRQDEITQQLMQATYKVEQQLKLVDQQIQAVMPELGTEPQTKENE